MVIMLTSIFFSGCLKTRTDAKEAEYQNMMQSQAIEGQKQASIRTMEMEEDMRSLSGRVDNIERQMSRQQQDREARASENEVKLNAYREAIEKLQGQIVQLTSDIENMKVRSKEAAEIEKTSKSPFDDGQKNYDKKDWKRAIIDFEKYREKFPKGKNFAKATLLIGESFQELGMNDEAKTFYDEVVARFPKSEEAKKVKLKTKKMK